MDFNVGDQVVHCAYGPGEIIQLDEKVISGRKGSYYIVQVNNLKLWVPAGEEGSGNLRGVTPKNQFKQYLQILENPGEDLPDDRLVRKTILLERLRDGKLDSICCVIRDLTKLSHQKKMSEYDSSIMLRAKSFLLAEWELVFSVSAQQASFELEQLLRNNA
jgi:RNA polymerase-interacting CarD/CdnL/TRCF family regulator